MSETVDFSEQRPRPLERKMPEVLRFNVFREGDVWLSRCVDTGHVTQGPDEVTVRERALMQIAQQIMLDWLFGHAPLRPKYRPNHAEDAWNLGRPAGQQVSGPHWLGFVAHTLRGEFRLTPPTRWVQHEACGLLYRTWDGHRCRVEGGGVVEPEPVAWGND